VTTYSLKRDHVNEKTPYVYAGRTVTKYDDLGLTKYYKYFPASSYGKKGNKKPKAEVDDGHVGWAPPQCLAALRKRSWCGGETTSKKVGGVSKVKEKKKFLIR